MAEQKPDIKYEVEAPPGRQCRDCKFFEPADEPSKGKCFGKDVIAQGTCNMFGAK